MYYLSMYHKQNKDDKYKNRKRIFELYDMIQSEEKEYSMLNSTFKTMY